MSGRSMRESSNGMHLPIWWGSTPLTAWSASAGVIRSWRMSAASRVPFTICMRPAASILGNWCTVIAHGCRGGKRSAAGIRDPHEAINTHRKNDGRGAWAFADCGRHRLVEDRAACTSGQEEQRGDNVHRSGGPKHLHNGTTGGATGDHTRGAVVQPNGAADRRP